MVEFGGNPANWCRVDGRLGRDGVVTWYPDDQKFSVEPTDDDRPAANQWVPVRINDRSVNVWGWRYRDGRVGWRTEDQTTRARRNGPRGDATGVVFGVDASKLKGSQVTGNDVGEKGKVAALMDSGTPEAPNCPREPERIPTPTLPAPLRINWLMIAVVVAGAAALFVLALSFVGLALLASKWRRR